MTLTGIEAIKEFLFDERVKNINIRNLILNSAPPFEWSGDKNHPIHTLGCYYFGIGEGFRFNENTVKEADEEMLKRFMARLQDIGTKEILVKTSI